MVTFLRFVNRNRTINDSSLELKCHGLTLVFGSVVTFIHEVFSCLCQMYTFMLLHIYQVFIEVCRVNIYGYCFATVSYCMIYYSLSYTWIVQLLKAIDFNVERVIKVCSEFLLKNKVSEEGNKHMSKSKKLCFLLLLTCIYIT